MSQELKAYLAAMQDEARQEKADVAAIQGSVDEVARVRQLLRRFPDKVRHKAMIPFGKHAFFEGELIHTNEFLVGLGCDLRLEASARQADGVLGRRQERAEAALNQARQQLEELQSRVEELSATLSNEDGEALVDIRQDFEESEALLASAQVPPQAVASMTAAPLERSADRVDTTIDRGKDAAQAGDRRGDVEAGDDDDRIFARLAELERLEAEEGSGGGEEGDGVGDFEGESKGERDRGEGIATEGELWRGLQRAAALTAAAGPAAAQPGPGSGVAQVGLASGHISGSLGSVAVPSVSSPLATKATKAAAVPGAKRMACTPLKKGFLLGGGEGGRRAATAAAAEAAGPGARAGSVRGAQATGNVTSSIGTVPLEGSSGTGRGSGADAGASRRVTFADESLPGPANDGSGAGFRQMLNAPGEPHHQQGGGGVPRVRPALKQGTSSVELAGQQATGERAPCVGDREGSGLRPGAAQVAALEDGGDAAMAMARAREEAFTGIIRERVSESTVEGSGNAGSGGTASSEMAQFANASGGETIAPKRVSKFKDSSVWGILISKV
ncbi:hypothetical protein Vretimale_8078 [Volvox reticuliferus]|uniref:Uncharacterized protein n=1 Tax=Volvox reticuliferus TaxID=1737510 RepID=A0A8J4GAN3_9CHLO|nr:hypothetical protein Vretimale_8078 [Volvox reticuliferus]